MPRTESRKYTKDFVFHLLEGVKGKSLGEVDKSGQFNRAKSNPKITGIAGDVIEQSVFGYDRDSNQECDIEIDGIITELKTTGVRIPKADLPKVKGLIGEAYNSYLKAKEGISITGVTFEPHLQLDFFTSHFWEKLEHLLIVFYEYQSYEAVTAAEYAKFPIIDYCFNQFSETERSQLQNDWEIVRDYLKSIYDTHTDFENRYKALVGFTHKLRPDLLLIELVPGFKLKNNAGKISYQKPRYRLKKTFIDYLVQGHFNKKRTELEISLRDPFSSFKELDSRCHALTEKYRGHTLDQLKQELDLNTDIKTKNFGACCIIAMFDARCKALNQISDFTKAGIIAKTITITPAGSRTEDMKLKRIDFDEWADRDIDFVDSDVYSYFSEHSFLCPIFCEYDSCDPSKTTFEGFKRFAFDDNFIEHEVMRTWTDSRKLIHQNALIWEYEYDEKGCRCKNKSGSYKGAPNFPKSSSYPVFFRGGAADSSDDSKTEVVNGIPMVPQFFWLKGSYIASKLASIDYL